MKTDIYEETDPATIPPWFGQRPEMRMEAFVSMEEMERWFQAKYCDKGGLVCASRELPPEDLKRIAKALNPDKVRMAQWLRQPGNEEWYGPRIAIVFSAWNELHRVHHHLMQAEKHRHRKQVEELEEKLAVAKRGQDLAVQELDAQSRKAADARFYISTLRGVLGQLVK